MESDTNVSAKRNPFANCRRVTSKKEFRWVLGHLQSMIIANPVFTMNIVAWEHGDNKQKHVQ